MADQEIEDREREWLIKEIRHSVEILKTYDIKADIVDDDKLVTLDTLDLEEAADRLADQVYSLDD
jgi:hypothetical protein